MEFCKLHFPYHPNHPDRTRDQMVQAARSAMSNIVEGNKHVSLKGYIYLVGIARGSLEELLKGITKKNIHPETDRGKPVGKEIW